VIADCGLMKPGETGEEIPFLQLGVENSGAIYSQHDCPGPAACVCDVDFTDEHLTQALPKKYIEENIAAIKWGYGLDKDSIARSCPNRRPAALRRATPKRFWPAPSRPTPSSWPAQR